MAAEVSNAPEGWKPDMTFVKRKVHLTEPPSEVVDPYRRVQIEKNIIDIDPEPNGMLINDTTLEVRADTAGRLAVGPVELGVVLTDDTQMVEAIFEPTKEDGSWLGIPPVRFRWDQDDYDQDRTWTIFTGDPAFRPFYRYRVPVTVKGTLFEPGRAWEGPWTATSGNGPLVIDVPRPDGEGVVTKSRSIPDPRVARLRALGPATGSMTGATAPASSRSGPASSGAGTSAKTRRDPRVPAEHLPQLPALSEVRGVPEGRARAGPGRASRGVGVLRPGAPARAHGAAA